MASRDPLSVTRINPRRRMQTSSVLRGGGLADISKETPRRPPLSVDRSDQCLDRRAVAIVAAVRGGADQKEAHIAAGRVAADVEEFLDAPGPAPPLPVWMDLVLRADVSDYVKQVSPVAVEYREGPDVIEPRVAALFERGDVVSEHQTLRAAPYREHRAHRDGAVSL